jgi:hypothetical protein
MGADSLACMSSCMRGPGDSAFLACFQVSVLYTFHMVSKLPVQFASRAVAVQQPEALLYSCKNVTMQLL